MSGFNTKERNNNGEYEITFYTESRQDFEKVQDLCRELIDHNKPVSIKGDLISREALKKTLNEIFEFVEVVTFDDIIAKIDNAPTVTPDKIQAIMSDYLVYRYEPQRSQGEWNYIQAGMCVCPFCGATPHKEYKDFCPKCGADMRGKEE